MKLETESKSGTKLETELQMETEPETEPEAQPETLSRRRSWRRSQRQSQIHQAGDGTRVRAGDMELEKEPVMQSKGDSADFRL